MKNILMSLLLLVSIGAQAEAIKSIIQSRDKATNELITSLKETASVMDRFYDGGGGTLAEAYRVQDIQLKQGESLSAAMTRKLKYILHRNYPITGDDGGYAFDSITNKSAEQILNELDRNFTDNEDAGEVVAKMTELLSKASRNKNLVVLLGEGSGNNTYAFIVAVLNLRTGEIIYLIDSNFGSDS